MQLGPPRRRRPRPVADAGLEALAPRQADLAKAWLLGLLEQVPLQDAPAVLASGLAQEGPELCGALLRALTSDAELARLGEGGDLESLAGRSGQLAGMGGLEAALRAVDVLGGVLWGAAQAALEDPDAELIAQLAERLTTVMESVRGAVLRGSSGRAEESDPIAAAEPALAAEPDAAADAIPGGEPGPRGEPALAEEPPLSAPPEVEARPARQTQVLWQGALGDEIDRARRINAPLALLLVELDDAGRLREVEPPAEAHAVFTRFLQAVRAAVRKQDILARETDARIWVIARDTGRVGAGALGRRAVEAVQAIDSWRGAPLTASVGVGVLGEDGTDTQALIAAAEEACLAAAASGVGLTGA